MKRRSYTAQRHGIRRGTLRCGSSALIALALFVPSIAQAFPTPVVESVYARSQPWLTFSTTTAATVTIQLNLTANCVDPVVSRSLPATTFCGGAAAHPDIWVHFFRDNGGEVVAPVRCDAAAGGSAVTCNVARSLPAGGLHGLMIHGGSNAIGNVTGTVVVTQSSPTSTTLLGSTPLALSGNLALSAADGSRAYDIATVLVPDGPRTNGSSDSGNRDNDYLGADATELWILNASGMATRADLAHAGVGAAALLSNVGAADAAQVVVRPWARPPTGFRVVVGGSVLGIGHGRSLWTSGGNPVVGNGRMRVVFNDKYAGNDSDGDGLSNTLESSLQLCTGASVFTSAASDTIACALGSALADPNRRTMIAMDPRDTDGDGISDLAEVLGSDISEGPVASASGGCIAGGSPVPLADADQTFPLWGFNPRHKDMFIEADRQVARDWTLGAPVAPAITTCTSPSHGVAPDSVAWPPMLPSAGMVYQQENSRIGPDASPLAAA